MRQRFYRYETLSTQSQRGIEKGKRKLIFSFPHVLYLWLDTKKTPTSLGQLTTLAGDASDCHLTRRSINFSDVQTLENTNADIEHENEEKDVAKKFHKGTPNV